MALASPMPETTPLPIYVQTSAHHVTPDHVQVIADNESAWFRFGPVTVFPLGVGPRERLDAIMHIADRMFTEAQDRLAELDREEHPTAVA